MNDDPLLFRILEALVAKDAKMRDERRDPSFILMQASRGGSIIKPSTGLDVTETDIRDLIERGYLRELSPPSSGVRVKFVVTSTGRAAGRRTPVATELDSDGNMIDAPAAPPLDEALGWIAEIEDRFPSVLDSGGALANQALADFDEQQFDGACRRIIELKREGLITFLDPGHRLPQLPASDRVGMGSEFQVTVAGRDRLRAHRNPQAGVVHQTVNATVAQVAGGNITNFISLGELLDAAERRLAALPDLDPHDREEAQSIIDKLRAATRDITVGALGGGGGTVLGTILMGLLHMHA